MNAPAEGEAEDVKKSRSLRVPADGVVPPLPAVADVREVLLRVRPPSGADVPMVSVSLTDRMQIAMFLAQLDGIDWKQEGQPLERTQLLAPDIELTIYETSGIHRDYGLYWEENSFVDSVTLRLLEADVKHLRLLVIDALIRQLAAERAKPAEPVEGAARLDTTSD